MWYRPIRELPGVGVIPSHLAKAAYQASEVASTCPTKSNQRQSTIDLSATLERLIRGQNIIMKP